MVINITGDLNRNELIRPERLTEIFDDLFASDSGPFTVSGSLLDYMIDDEPVIVEFEPSSEGVSYRFDVNWPEEFTYENQTLEQNRIRDGFLRAGIAEYPTLPEVMTELRNQDDVILGLDSDILEDRAMTSTLLEEIYAAPFPNWILVAIPRLVMSQIEKGAKDQFVEGNHPRVGWPTYDGRVAQCALQEIMTLRENDPDRPGMAVMTVGEIESEANHTEEDSWRTDALIRDQFKQYLNDIGFRKGTYFLSENRVNVMLSGTEGGDTLYLKKPEYDGIRTGGIRTADFARLVYELCIQFGSIHLESKTGDRFLDLSIYWPGKNHSDWKDSKMHVDGTW